MTETIGVEADRRADVARRPPGRGRGGPLVGALLATLLPGVAGLAPAGAAPQLTFDGRVFRDDDANGEQGGGEPGLPGLKVVVSGEDGFEDAVETGATGDWSIEVDPGHGPRWRVEVIDEADVYDGAPVVGEDKYAPAVYFVDAEGRPDAWGPITRVIGLIDPRFATDAPLVCFSGLVASSGDDSVHQFDSPAAPVPGAPLEPPASQGGNQAWIPTGSGGLDAPTSMALAPDGDVWVGSGANDAIRRYDGVTGAFEQAVSIPSMKLPVGVTLGPDGWLYVADRGARKIYRYDPITGASAAFTNPSEFNLGGGTNLDPDQGIVFGPDGYLYVSAGTASQGRVMQIDPGTGKATGRWWILDRTAHGLDVGPDGLLYATTGSSGAGTVWRIDPTANTATKILSVAEAWDVEFAPDASALYVVAGSGRILGYSWPALGALPDYVPAPNATYTHSTPRSLLLWTPSACSEQLLRQTVGDRVWNDLDRDGIQDPAEPGLSAVAVTIHDTDGNLLGETTTDADGDWSWRPDWDGVKSPFEVVVSFSGPILEQAKPTDLRAGGDPRSILLDSDAEETKWGWGARFAIGHSLKSPDSGSVDAGFVLPPGALGGHLFLDTDNDGVRNVETDLPARGVPLELWDEAGKVRWAAPRTNDDGRWSVTGLPEGTYRVIVAGETTKGLWHSATGSLDPAKGPTEPAGDPDDDKLDVDDGTWTGERTETEAIELTFGKEPVDDGDDENGNRTLDLGFVVDHSIGDRVWSDDDRDGVQDAGEGAPVLPVTVELQTPAGAVVATTTTGVGGAYRFDQVAPGSYRLRFVPPSGYTFTTRDVGSDAADSDADATGVTATFTVSDPNGASVRDDTRDAGLVGTQLGDLVFDDRDDDGVRDAGEPGIAGVPVSLMDSAGTTELAATTTAGDGTYRFRGVPAGSYRVRIPFAALYSGAAVGFVSSVGQVAESGATSYEPAPDPDDDVDGDDNGSAQWTPGDVLTEPITLTLAAEPTAEDANAYTNLTADLGLHKPEGVFSGSGYFNTVMGDNPIGYWRLGERNTTTATDASGNGKHGTYSGTYTQGTPGAIANDPDTSTSFTSTTTSKVNLNALNVDTTAGAKTTVEFSMYWNGTLGGMPFGWNSYDLWFRSDGRFGFNSACSDAWGIAAAPLANRWVHVVAVFTNQATIQNKLYINGVQQTLGGNIACNGSAATIASVSGWRTNTGYLFPGRVDDLSIYRGELTQAQVTAHFTASGIASGTPVPTIRTVAGNGSTADATAGAAALNNPIGTPWSVLPDPAGGYYVNNETSLLRVGADGIVQRVATLNSGSWSHLAWGPDGNVYVVEFGACRIRKVTPAGVVSTFAGTGSCATSGDGGPATAAAMNRPGGLGFDRAGNAYVAEYSGNRIRRIAPNGVITTFATGFNRPWSLAVDTDDTLVVGEETGGNRIWRVSTSGVLTQLATDANRIEDVAVSGTGILYTTWTTCTVRRLQVDNVLVAGTSGSCGFLGDGGPAADARISGPSDIAVGTDGTIYLVDSNNRRIRTIR